MSSPRISPLDPPYTEEVQQSFDVVMPAGVPPLNIFRTVGRNPRVLSRMVRSGLLDPGSISLADRELVILRACGLCGADYEWNVHVAVFSVKARFTQDQLGSTREPVPEAELWSESQRALISMVDSLHASAQIEDDLWQELTMHYSDEQLVELVMLAGLYHAVSFVVNAFQVEQEAV